MAIVLEKLTGVAYIARMYDDEHPAPLAPFVASAVFEWVAPRDLWIKAFSGRLTRRTLRDLLTKLVELGVHTVLARRADGHILPLGVTDAEGVTRIRVADLSARFSRQGASDWVDLEDSQRAGL